jgi:hypothetical protein
VHIDDKKARAARDVGLEAVVEQQKMGGRMPSQREAEDFVATILPRALEDAQAGVDAASNKPKPPPQQPVAGIVQTDDSVTCDINFATGEVSNVVQSGPVSRAQVRNRIRTSAEIETACVESRVRYLFKIPEWSERIKKCGKDWYKFRKVLDDSNSIPGLGRWDAILRGPDHKIFSGAGGKL